MIDISMNRKPAPDRLSAGSIKFYSNMIISAWNQDF